MTSSPTDPPPSSSTDPPSTSYCPSVPISLYRELAEELRDTQAQLNFFKAQNQQLLQQNQQLRLEAANILGSTRKLEAIAVERTEKNQSATPKSKQEGHFQVFPAQKPEFFAIHAASHQASEVSSRSMGSWRWVAIFSIVALLAFGIGFLAVPSLMTLMKGNNR